MELLEGGTKTIKIHYKKMFIFLFCFLVVDLTNGTTIQFGLQLKSLNFCDDKASIASSQR